MIVLTGAAGFIGSAMLTHLNDQGHTDIMLVDDFDVVAKQPNWEPKAYTQTLDRKHFIQWFQANHGLVKFVFHLGARTDTSEKDYNLLKHLNLHYSQSIWRICAAYKIPLVYASSAATYGDGSYGFSDSHELTPVLEPLNPYGDSKQEFDVWALEQEKAPPRWAGLKFFNVYGPNEYHKGRMASVILHTYRQIQETGRMRLFRSHKEGIKDGEQRRDFIYVKDIVEMLYFFYQFQVESGLYNAGTGRSRTFMALATAVFDALQLTPDIDFIDTPADIRNTYQYYTEADMQKLIDAGYTGTFTELEDGVRDYVTNYLEGKRYW